MLKVSGSPAERPLAIGAPYDLIARIGTTQEKGEREMPRGKRATKPTQQAESYKHPESTNLMRPDVGTQPQFKKRKPPVTYRYDSSLSPALDWDEQSPAREDGERKLAALEQNLSVVRSELSSVRPYCCRRTAGGQRTVGKPPHRWLRQPLTGR